MRAPRTERFKLKSASGASGGLVNPLLCSDSAYKSCDTPPLVSAQPLPASARLKLLLLPFYPPASSLLPSFDRILLPSIIRLLIRHSIPPSSSFHLYSYPMMSSPCVLSSSTPSYHHAASFSCHPFIIHHWSPLMCSSSRPSSLLSLLSSVAE